MENKAEGEKRPFILVHCTTCRLMFNSSWQSKLEHFSTVLSPVHKLKPGSAAYWPYWLYYDVPSYWPHSRHSTLLIPAAAPPLPRTRELSTQNVELDTEAEGLPPSIILFRGQFTSLQFSWSVSYTDTVLLVPNYTLRMKTYDRYILPKLPNSCFNNGQSRQSI